jgi:hypothetical protein
MPKGSLKWTDQYTLPPPVGVRLIDKNDGSHGSMAIFENL